jgi:quinol-cytochrome oxidoreductase complex cytochrome b subunit
MVNPFKERTGSTERIRAVSKNFFLHFHSPKIHAYSLKPNFTFGLGIINLSLFLILLATGILLMIYYKPSVEKAYFSILDINNIVIGGRYIRNMHRWAAHGLVFMAILHMSRVFFTASYTGEGRMTWNLGIGLLIVTLFASFSGYLLPWDQLGFWAVTIASYIISSTRELTDMLHLTALFDPGLVIKKILLGGSDVAQEALTRFYLLHVVLFPLLFILLLALHFWRIRKKGGLHLPADADQRVQSKTSRKDPLKTTTNSQAQLFSWPVALWAELSVFIMILAILAVFAYFINAPLKEIANPSMPENPAKAPWYFLGVQELVSYSAFGGGLLIPLLVIIALFSIPYLDNKKENIGIWFSGRAGIRSALFSGFFASITITILMLIVVQWGWIRNWIPEIPQGIIIFINPGTVTALVFIFCSTFIERRTGSRRLATISLFSCILTGFVWFTIIGIWFRGPDWQFILWPFF